MKAKSKKATKVAVVTKPAARKRGRPAGRKSAPKAAQPAASGEPIGIAQLFANLMQNGEWTVHRVECGSEPADVEKVVGDAVERMAAESRAQAQRKLNEDQQPGPVSGPSVGHGATRWKTSPGLGINAPTPTKDGLRSELEALGDELSRLRLNIANLRAAIDPVCGPVSEDDVAPTGPALSPLCETAASLRRQVTDAANIIRNITAAIAI
jgi:hypothetical protein